MTKKTNFWVAAVVVYTVYVGWGLVQTIWEVVSGKPIARVPAIWITNVILWAVLYLFLLMRRNWSIGVCLAFAFLPIPAFLLSLLADIPAGSRNVAEFVGLLLNLAMIVLLILHLRKASSLRDDTDRAQ